MPRCVPRTLAISQRARPDGEDLLAWAAAAAEAGVDALQLREKDLAVGRLCWLAGRIRERLPSRVLLLINGRVDVAVGCGATGVHLTSRALPLARLRQRFPYLLIGASTHHLDEVERARDAGADYVTFGPVFAPTSKSSREPTVGVVGLARAAALGLPVLALGGVTLARLPELAAAGAAGVAAIGAFRDPFEARELVAAAEGLFPRCVAAGAAP